MRWFRLILRIALLVVVIGGGVWGTRTISEQKTKAQRRPPPPATRLTVEAIQVKPIDYQINVNTFGTIQPHTQSTLVSQVSGSILRIAPSFRDGGFFEKGALLLEIDPTEYEAEVRLTETTLTQSYLAFKEEQARSQQAIRNWQRLGQKGFPSDLAWSECCNFEFSFHMCVHSSQRTAEPFVGRAGISTCVDLCFATSLQENQLCLHQ